MYKTRTLSPLRLVISRDQGFSFIEILITLFIVACMIQSLLQTQWFIQRQHSQHEQILLHWLKQSNQYELTSHYAQ